MIRWRHFGQMDRNSLMPVLGLGVISWPIYNTRPVKLPQIWDKQEDLRGEWQLERGELNRTHNRPGCHLLAGKVRTITGTRISTGTRSRVEPSVTRIATRTLPESAPGWEPCGSFGYGSSRSVGLFDRQELNFAGGKGRSVSATFTEAANLKIGVGAEKSTSIAGIVGTLPGSVDPAQFIKSPKCAARHVQFWR